MRIGILNEQHDHRVAINPEVAQKLIAEGNELWVEKNAGAQAFFSDQDYATAGAKLVEREQILKDTELVISIHPVNGKELSQLQGKVYISSFAPFTEGVDLSPVAEAGITALSLDMIPRSTIAQSMDILSSMASIAGYLSVIEAAKHLPRYFPMLTTAAGTIPPAKVLVLGAGVAGLQAIATAKRLGAVIEAFDTRAAAKEEVQSLGAKFVEVEGATDDKAAGGYAVEQSEEYKKKQQALIKEKIEKSDVVITTAQLRGKRAPILIKKDMVEAMNPGSVIVDLAASTGGNCELTKNEAVIEHKGVTIIGNSNLAAELPMNASQLYAKNIHNYLKVFLKEGKLELDFDNEIIKSSCIAHDGTVRYENPFAANHKPLEVENSN
ncbi:Re/Si-specific NAD(P)(+) transhydrogenase subunit alpha [Rapidithrix thailandica]|uniref:NAD(P) transhydrogenase subunit alpha part 1 n=1 Tax=Rapidithrix thailandica TaxID=413964 RepID=A0AAW9SAK6_9BACT